MAEQGTVQQTAKEIPNAYTEEELKLKKRFRKRLLISVIILVVLAVGGWFMIGFMLKYTTYARMKTMVSRAHSFASVVQEWEDRGKEIESGIWRVDEKDGDFNKFVVYYFGDYKDEWFGLVLDDAGEIRYTMYSKVEIPEEYLQDPPDYEEQFALLDSFFAFKRRKAIAVWDPDNEWKPDGFDES